MSQGRDKCALHAAKNAGWPLYDGKVQYLEDAHNMSIGTVARYCDHTKATITRIRVSGESIHRYVLSDKMARDVIVIQYVYPLGDTI